MYQVYYTLARTRQESAAWAFEKSKERPENPAYTESWQRAAATNYESARRYYELGRKYHRK